MPERQERVVPNCRADLLAVHKYEFMRLQIIGRRRRYPVDVGSHEEIEMAGALVGMDRVVAELLPNSAAEAGLFAQLPTGRIERRFATLDAAAGKAEPAAARAVLVHMQQDQSAVGAGGGHDRGPPNMELV